jgi:hypothetical protein
MQYQLRLYRSALRVHDRMGRHQWQPGCQERGGRSSRAAGRENSVAAVSQSIRDISTIVTRRHHDADVARVARATSRRFAKDGRQLCNERMPRTVRRSRVPESGSDTGHTRRYDRGAGPFRHIDIPND